MKEIHFFAETHNAEVIEFYAVTFMFDGKLFGINDSTIMKARLKNMNYDDYVATYQAKLAPEKGMFHTGFYNPTHGDLPILGLRKIWTENWL